MNYAVVIVAAGRGERLGAATPKALVKVAGKKLLEHALKIQAELNPAELVVVYPAEHRTEFEILTRQFKNIKLVAGGVTRQDSVANGVKAVSLEKVLVHDAARCFTPKEVFESVAEKLDSAPAVIPVLQIPDTIKRVSNQEVLETVDRNNLVLSQTPQGFLTSELLTALSETTENFTDEAALMQSKGHRVLFVPGDEQAFKVTYPSDIEKAQQMFASLRTGIGVDAHEFSKSEQLVLGLLTWPELPKLEGHSDGDAIAHAVVDALLGAAGLGDIGSNFGVDRPQFAGASGEVFLVETLRLLAAAGFGPGNVSVQVVGDKPKIGPRRAELESKLAEVIGCQVSIAATTTDGLGFLADSRGIAAVATAYVVRQS